MQQDKRVGLFLSIQAQDFIEDPVLLGLVVTWPNS